MVNTRSKTKSTQPQSIVVSNDDLLTEILIRLPVTSILRFKTVSKHWRSLLTHTQFTHRYDKQLKFPGLFSHDASYFPFDVVNRSPFGARGASGFESYFDHAVRIVHSCNGLLLCCSMIWGLDTESVCKYYVLNPTTKQIATIPPVPGGQDICCMALAYHQTDCSHYKVVCVRSLEPDGNLFQIQLYSYETRKWKISVESFSAHKHVVCEAVYFNGAVFVYWDGTVDNSSQCLCDYFYFKIDVEQLLTFPLPEGWMASKTIPKYFGESRGHLHLIRDYGLSLNVYEMLRDQTGWFVKYQVRLDELQAAFPEIIRPFPYKVSVVDVVRGEKEEDTFMVLCTGEKLITYNVLDKSLKQIDSFTIPFWGDYSNFHRNIESLTSF